MLEVLPDWPMFGLSDDIRPALAQARKAGAPAALATIVALDGGGPRPVGTQMLLGPAGVDGFLSGGCLEGDVAAHAVQVLEDGLPLKLVYGEGSPWPDIRLLCGARIELLLERLDPGDPACGALLGLAERRVSALWLSDGARRACGPADAPPAPWPGAFVRRFDPALRFVVIGSDPTALAMARLGVEAGWSTVLVRPKGPTEPPPIPGLIYRRDDDPSAGLAAVGLDAFTAVAVATHESERDHAALVAALPSPAFYVGALGARRRLPERQHMLRQAGLSEDAIGRLKAPIGLDIGGKAPWEVAMAVTAQIVAERGQAHPPLAQWAAT